MDATPEQRDLVLACAAVLSKAHLYPDKVAPVMRAASAATDWRKPVDEAARAEAERYLEAIRALGRQKRGGLVPVGTQSIAEAIMSSPPTVLDWWVGEVEGMIEVGDG